MPKFHNTRAGEGVGRNNDGVHRTFFDPIGLNDLITDTGRERDEALEGYFDSPRPANDNRRVYRSVLSPRPYDNICSTRFRYVDVSLPRVSMIDGAYRGAATRVADNDNRRAA